MVEEQETPEGANSAISSLRGKIAVIRSVIIGALVILILTPVVLKIGFAAFVFGLMVLNLIVIVHELGHLFAAIRAKVKVDAFSLGMGPVLCKATKWGIEWRLSLFPLGGYVSETALGDGEDPISPTQRLRFAWGGPFASLVLCFVAIFFASLLGYNQDATLAQPLTIDRVITNTAESAGLRQGDVVEKIGKVNLRSNVNESLPLAIEGYEKESKVDFLIRRDQQSKVITVPVTNGLIGVMWKQTSTPISPSESAKKAGSFTMRFLATPLVVPYMIITRPAVALKGAGGPGSILAIAGLAIKGDLPLILFVIGLLSGAIGGFQLLPLMPLDGGHIVVSIMRLVLRKQSKKLIEGATLVYTWLSIMLVLALFGVALSNDLRLR